MRRYGGRRRARFQEFGKNTSDQIGTTAAVIWYRRKVEPSGIEDRDIKFDLHGLMVGSYFGGLGNRHKFFCA